MGLVTSQETTMGQLLPVVVTLVVKRKRRRPQSASRSPPIAATRTDSLLPGPNADVSRECWPDGSAHPAVRCHSRPRRTGSPPV